MVTTKKSQLFLKPPSSPKRLRTGPACPISMRITTYNTQKDLPLSLKSVREHFPLLLQRLHVKTDEIILHFVTERKICRLHEDFFADPSSTDCISFPMDPSESYTEESHHILGEIFVCPKVAIAYAQEKGLDPYEETTLYIVHGLLHLLGYDDLDPESRKTMRRMEKKCLRLLSPFSLSPHKKTLP